MSKQNKVGFIKTTDGYIPVVGTPALTEGEIMVGLTFNPSDNPKVIDIKQAMAKVYDVVNALPDSPYKTHTLNAIIDTQMSAVKCLFIKEK